jgi:hypothetical protein
MTCNVQCCLEEAVNDHTHSLACLLRLPVSGACLSEAWCWCCAWPTAVHPLPSVQLHRHQARSELPRLARQHHWRGAAAVQQRQRRLLPGLPAEVRKQSTTPARSHRCHHPIRTAAARLGLLDAQVPVPTRLTSDGRLVSARPLPQIAGPAVALWCICCAVMWP